MKENPAWGSNNFSATQNFPYILYNPNVLIQQVTTYPYPVPDYSDSLRLIVFLKLLFVKFLYIM
jgi:hypothetical protein